MNIFNTIFLWIVVVLLNALICTIAYSRMHRYRRIIRMMPAPEISKYLAAANDEDATRTAREETVK